MRACVSVSLRGEWACEILRPEWGNKDLDLGCLCAQVAQRDKLNMAKPLSLLDKVKGLSQVPTPTPDEKNNAMSESMLMDPMDKIEATVPVLAKPGQLEERKVFAPCPC